MGLTKGRKVPGIGSFGYIDNKLRLTLRSNVAVEGAGSITDIHVSLTRGYDDPTVKEICSLLWRARYVLQNDLASCGVGRGFSKVDKSIFGAASYTVLNATDTSRY